MSSKVFFESEGVLQEYVVLDCVYEPAEDSYLLLESVLKENVKGKKALEVGSGCGLIAVELALRGADVTAVDVNPVAVENTLINAVKHGVRVIAFESNLFEKVRGKYDLIVFNPPYVPTEKNEKKDLLSLSWDGGVDGSAVIRKFLSKFKGFLAGNGKCFLLVSSKNNIKESLEEKGWREVGSKNLFFEKLFVMKYEKIKK